MDFNGTGLIERPDLAEIWGGHGIGGIQLPVAGRNLEPIAHLKRTQTGTIRRRFRAHDENVGVQSRIRG